jgi:hypothetical protein
LYAYSHRVDSANHCTDPLLMNAYNNVNLASACVVTSVEYAEQLGISQKKWVYLLGGAGTKDSETCKLC